MKIVVLGTGTSTGVPVPGCHCAVCRSDNPRNERLRASIYIEISGAELDPHAVPTPAPLRILIDSSPDLRTQALKYRIETLDAVLYTHSHADHIFGLDDLRCFNFTRGAPIDIYANDSTAEELERIFRYAFIPDPNYRGGSPPQLQLHRVKPETTIELSGVSIRTLGLLHGPLPILGFRIGDFAYLTDCSAIPEPAAEHLQDLQVLIIDGLRNRPHPTHFTQEQAVREVERLRPKMAYLTHVSHDIDHHDGNSFVRSLTSCDVELAYDGLKIELPLHLRPS